MINMLLLSDPDNIPDGYGGLDLNNGGWIMFSILLGIILVLLFIIMIMSFKLDKYKDSNKTEELELSEEEKQTINELRKLSKKERQIVNDTIKVFNKPKDE